MDSRPHVPGYHLGDLIATGSTASVWVAGRTPDGDDLAVKVVPAPARADLDDLAFELSALSVTRGAGQHLVRVLDVVPVGEPAPAVAIVMERLRHGTITELVRARGHLLPGEVVTLLTPVTHTLAELHDAAVVHGDLSPSNVGLDEQGRPVILDLGVAAVIGTPRDDVYGTPGFVAPEVVCGGAPSPSADVYAVGALGWFALTGEPPPVPAERPALAVLAPSVPEALVLAIEEALHPDPGSRPGARELGTAVYAAAAALPVRPGAPHDPATMLTRRVRDLARAAASEDADAAGRSRADRRAALRRRSRAAHLRVLAAFVAMTLIGGVGVAVASAQRGPATPSAPGAPAAPARTVQEGGAETTAVLPAPSLAETLDRLVQARAQAWNDADPGLLADCFAPDSAALERDREVLVSALDQGHRYEGVAFVADEVDVLSETEDRLTLEATLTTGSYAVRTTAGSESRAASSVRVRLVLVPAGSHGAPAESVAAGRAWRIAEVEEAAAWMDPDGTNE